MGPSPQPTPDKQLACAALQKEADLMPAARRPVLMEVPAQPAIVPDLEHSRIGGLSCSAGANVQEMWVCVASVLMPAGACCRCTATLLAGLRSQGGRSMYRALPRTQKTSF